ncbi:MAG: hypothetical protein DME26_10460 [Verrucomicrobia bacterium]|nr:MAG: hypothetical protein DME26_10460 [Verrucomicrobiota bacterium]
MNTNDFSPEFLIQPGSARDGGQPSKDSRPLAAICGSDLLLKDEVYQIVGCAMEVLNELEHGLHEKPSENALVVEFGLRNIPFVQQPQYDAVYQRNREKATPTTKTSTPTIFSFDVLCTGAVTDSAGCELTEFWLKPISLPRGSPRVTSAAPRPTHSAVDSGFPVNSAPVPT